MLKLDLCEFTTEATLEAQVFFVWDGDGFYFWLPSHIKPTKQVSVIEPRSSLVSDLSVVSWNSSSCCCTSSPVLVFPSISAAISWRCESVRLEVHQSDASRQPGWLDPQWECQSSLPGNFSDCVTFPILCLFCYFLITKERDSLTVQFHLNYFPFQFVMIKKAPQVCT